MTNDKFTEYMHDQIHQIEIDKWLEGERICRDPGQQFVREWITQNSLSFRKQWESSHDIHT